MQARTILITTGQTIPGWAHEISTILRIHGALSNRELAALLDRPEPRVSEACAKLHRAGLVTRRKVGKERMITLH